MSGNLNDDSSSPQVKNTFLHYEDDWMVNEVDRQKSAPAPSMQRQLSISSPIDSHPMFMKADIQTMKPSSPLIRTCQAPRYVSEPEGEPTCFSRQVSGELPSSFSRQVSAAFSDIEFMGSSGPCRQETELAWPTWVAPPQVYPVIAGSLTNPEVHWLAAATLPTSPVGSALPLPMLPAMSSPYSAPLQLGLQLGMASKTSPGNDEIGSMTKSLHQTFTDFEDITVDEKSHKDAKPTSKKSNGLPRSRRKHKSLITLAYKAQTRQPQQSVEQPEPQVDTPQPVCIDVAPQPVCIVDTPQPQALQVPTDKSTTTRCKFCPYCGQGLQARFKFCMTCGVSVSTIRGSLGMEAE